MIHLFPKRLREMKKALPPFATECALICAFATTTAYAARVSLNIDTTQGVRLAAEMEQISYSTAWETSGTDGVMVVVSVNGEELGFASGNGTMEWHPPRNGTYTLTHRVMRDGTQIGETLAATFQMSYGAGLVLTDADRPVISGGTGGLSFSVHSGLEGATLSVTVTNIVPNAWYTAFTTTDLNEPFRAECRVQAKIGDAIIPFEIDASAPSKFVKIVASATPIPIGALLKDELSQ